MFTNWFGIIAGVASLLGLAVSILTLCATKSTKEQLKKYKLQVDVTEQLNILKSAANTKSWDRDLIISCQSAEKRIRILYRERISEGLASALDSLDEKLVALKRNPESRELSDDIVNDLISLNIMVEKELSI